MKERKIMTENNATIIDGKALAKTIRSEISAESVRFFDKNGRAPGLAVIIVGEDPASKIYVRNKHKACAECGFYSEVIELPESTTESELTEKIEELNDRAEIDGILVQLPLPMHIDSKKIIGTIRPDKDVDGFHPINVGKLLTGNFVLAPCTPAGVIEMLHRYGVRIEGKKCVVVGRSNIVGKPMSILLMKENGTVTVCHSKTANLKEECRTADILVVAVGHAHLITADMIKPGAVVIDVGINRHEDGSLCGDVCFEEGKKVASLISPVPGGVGPMTITMLMQNTLVAAINRTSGGK